MAVYLLHYKLPHFHAQHYLGSSDVVEARVNAHRNGCSRAVLPTVFYHLGIEFELARTWEGGREKERQLKRRKNNRRLCPICRGKVKP